MDFQRENKIQIKLIDKIECLKKERKDSIACATVKKNLR